MILKGKKNPIRLINDVKICVKSIVELIKNLREEGFQYYEIAVGFRTKDSLKELKTTLHQLKIPYNTDFHVIN